MRSPSFLLVALGLAAMPAVAGAEALVPPGRTPVIATPQGPVRGVVRNGVIEVRGIPYARKPDRWSPPQPAGDRKELHDGGSFGPACPQLARFGLTEASDAEDCLNLNVSRPRSIPAGRRLPVLVWIHGGAFVGGSSNLYRLDALARRDLVVVTPNYRLGVLGFMPHPAFEQASNGNLGLMDQREALHWVQRNIAAFGGDPTNVTIAGESAGAGSICAHLATPELSGGLVHKAVLISGGCLAPLPTVQTYSKLGSEIGAAVGCSAGNLETQLACLRGKPLQQLLEAGDRATQGKTMSFGPSTGAAQANPRSMAEALAQGKVLNVPLLMGGARDELRLYMGYEQQSSNPITSTNYADRLFSHYIGPEEQNLKPDSQPLKGRRERILARYPLRDPNRSAETVGSVISHYNPQVGISNCLYLHTATQMRERIGMPIYGFEFADPNAVVLGVGITATPDPKMDFGAVHSSALNYLFPHLSNTSRIDAPDLLPASQPLADQMQQVLATFATKGVPSAAGLPAWPVFKAGTNVMRLMPGKSAAYDANTYHSCSFWRDLFPQQLS